MRTRRLVKAASSAVLPLACVIGMSVLTQAQPAPVEVPPNEVRPAGVRPATDRRAQVPATDPRLSFVGHWGRAGAKMVTPNSGSELRFRFTGQSLAGRFDTSAVTSPPQIYVSVDGAAPTLYRVDRDRIDFTPAPLPGPEHTAEIVVKDIDEHANRWVVPMQSGLALTGLELDPGARVRRTAPPGPLSLEVYGDSITQGVKALCPGTSVDCGDGTRSFAHLTGRAFHARTTQVGFGRQGILVAGNGGVPTAVRSFGWNFQDSPADSRFRPDAVVVNQGTNDGAFDSAAFRPAYLGYLQQIRAADRQAWIFAMRPFGGYHADDVAWAVAEMKDPKIVLVDTTGWLSAAAGDYTDSVHPTVGAHAKAARLLTEVIARTTGWTADPIG